MSTVQACVVGQRMTCCLYCSKFRQSSMLLFMHTSSSNLVDTQRNKSSLNRSSIALACTLLCLRLLHGICRYATSNTRSGIESCGILAGRLQEKQGVFVISTLIIPKQEGTSDTVQALNEEEIFDVQDKRALYPLGWIHTHPTQTCFLSSVDVHTQCGYQVCHGNK